MHCNGTNQQNPQNKRNSSQSAFSQIRETLRNLVDGESIRNDECDSSNNTECSQSYDEGINFQPCGQESINETPEHTAQDADENSHRNGISLFERHGTNQSTE